MTNNKLNLKTQRRTQAFESEPPSPMSHAGILARHAGYKTEPQPQPAKMLPSLSDDSKSPSPSPGGGRRIAPRQPAKTLSQQLNTQHQGLNNSQRKFSFGKFGFFGRRQSSSASASSNVNNAEETEDERQRRAQQVVRQTQTSVDHSPGTTTTKSRSNKKNHQQHPPPNPPSLQGLYVSSPYYVTPTRPPVGLPLLPPRDPQDTRITLVLDLDETLVRSSFDCTFEFDFEAPFALNGCWCTARVRKRPLVDDFLLRVSQHFELVLMTAGVEPYASLVLDILDERRVLEYRFYRDSCTKTDTGLLVKDLSRFNRDLDRTIIVDNSPNAYLWHPQNAVDVDDFVGDMRDRQLATVADFLDVIKEAKDVRPHLGHWRKGKNYAHLYNDAATGPAVDRKPNGVCANNTKRR